MTDETPGRGHNNPPLADQLATAYAVTQLAEDHAALAAEVQTLVGAASAIDVVNTAEDSTAAGAMVIALRDLTQKVDNTHDAVKKPVLDAGRNVDAFFNGLNTSAGRTRGPLTTHKIRLESLISGYGFRVAAEQRRIAEEAATEQRRLAQIAADKAAEAEAANKPQVAGVILDSAVKSEKIADTLDARAQGPVQEVARTRTPVATLGLRAEKGFEVADRDALRATLGPLGNSFTADAVMAAIRKFRVDAEQFEAWAFANDDQHAQERDVIAKPTLPGVRFFIRYVGSVRA